MQGESLDIYIDMAAEQCAARLATVLGAHPPEVVQIAGPAARLGCGVEIGRRIQRSAEKHLRHFDDIVPRYVQIHVGLIDDQTVAAIHEDGRHLEPQQKRSRPLRFVKPLRRRILVRKVDDELVAHLGDRRDDRAIGMPGHRECQRLRIEFVVRSRNVL